jgi:hypothetical protein
MTGKQIGDAMYARSISEARFAKCMLRSERLNKQKHPLQRISMFRVFISALILGSLLPVFSSQRDQHWRCADYT